MRTNSTILKRYFLGALISLSAAVSYSQSPVVPYFDMTIATGGPNQGGYYFQTATNTFYTAGFTGAGQGIRKVEALGAPVNALTYDGGTGYFQSPGVTYQSTILLGETDWTRYVRSSSLTNNGGNGTFDNLWSGQSVVGNMALNPVALTINGTPYAAGTLLIATDQMVVNKSSSTAIPTNNEMKVVYAYDLRPVSPTSVNTGRDRNGNGIVDWNDVFDTIVTRQDIMTKAGTSTNTVNLARNFAFSPTTQKHIYINDAASTHGGIWRVNLELTGAAALERVANVTTDPRINTEPTVLATASKDYDSWDGVSGDQIFFDLSSANGTGVSGGIGYVVHDVGANMTTAGRVLMHGTRAQAFTGLTTNGNTSIALDMAGSFFFNESSSDAMLKFDPQGRVSKLISEEQHNSYQVLAVPTSTSQNDLLLDLTVRTATLTNGADVFSVTEVLYGDSTARTTVGLLAFDPADLNRDGAISSADTALFIQEFNRDVTGGLARSDAAYQGYLNADLNASANVVVTTSPAFAGLNVAAVDNRDLLTLFQFINKKAGDANLDGQIDAADQAILTANLGTSGNWLRGDFNRDGTIDAADQALLTANFGPANDYSLAGFDPQGKLVGSTGLWADVQKAGSVTIDADTNLVISKSAGSTTQGPTANTAAVYIDLGTNETGGPANTLNLVSGVRVDLLEGMLVRPNGVLNTTGATLRLGVEGYAATLAVLDGGQVNGNLSLEGSLDYNTSGAATFNGTIKNNGSTPSSFTKTGAGQLDITAPHTYTGVSSVAGGTLQLTAANLIPDASPVTVAGAGTLNLNGFSETVGSLAGAGAVQFGSTAGTTLTTGGLNTNTSFSGVISGTGNLVKQGTGIFTLSTTTGNTFVGNTTINGGTISVSNNIQLGATSSTVTLNGGTLRSSASGTAFSSARSVDVTATGGSIEVSNASATATFSGPVNNQGVLNKIGNGTATFSGAQTIAAGAAVNVNAGTLNLNPTVNATLGAGANATVASGATLNLGGTANALSDGSTVHADVTNNGTLTAATAGKRVGNIAGTGTTSVTVAGATLTANSIRQATLNIGAGNTVTVAANGGDSGTSKVTTLSINATGKLDLANNDLIVDNGSLTAVTALLAAGLDINGSYGNGPGITSSAFASNLNFNTVLGIAPNSELNFTSFSGQAVDANDLLVKYTYFGDADLSGSVDTSTDFDLYITGLTSGGSQGGWLYGDFDYSGTVDSSTDFDLYITGLTSQSGTLLTTGSGSNLVQAVPEPGTVGLLAAGFFGGGIALLRRRRMLSPQ